MTVIILPTVGSNGNDKRRQITPERIALSEVDNHVPKTTLSDINQLEIFAEMTISIVAELFSDPDDLHPASH